MNTATATRVAFTGPTKGTRVWFISPKGLIDHSVAGTVTEYPAFDPDQNAAYAELCEVTWDDGETDICSIDDVTEVWGSA